MRIPTWIPSEPMFPKPQQAYVAISWDRGDRSAYSALVASSENALYSF